MNEGDVIEFMMLYPLVIAITITTTTTDDVMASTIAFNNAIVSRPALSCVWNIIYFFIFVQKNIVSPTCTVTVTEFFINFTNTCRSYLNNPPEILGGCDRNRIKKINNIRIVLAINHNLLPFLLLIRLLSFLLLTRHVTYIRTSNNRVSCRQRNQFHCPARPGPQHNWKGNIKCTSTPDLPGCMSNAWFYFSHLIR